MNKLFFKIFLVFTLFFSFANAKVENEIYFLPNKAKAAKEKIIDYIKDSKKNIYVSMYNFSYKKFAKPLGKASKRGVKVTVYLDKSKVKKDDSIYKYLIKKGVKVVVADKKLHTKIAIFDEKTIVLGSTNWTKDSFSGNYEVILFSNDKEIISKSLKFLKKLGKTN